MRKLLLASALVVLPALSAFAAENPWLGTWKLDPAKSEYPSYTITYSKLANGLYHFAAGGDFTFDFGTDGKEYKVFSDSTVAQTPAGDSDWDTVWKTNGKIISNDHGQLSPDNKTLTMTRKHPRPDGSIASDEIVYTRDSGTTGLAGAWRLTKQQNSPYTLIVSSPSEGVMRVESPEFKQIIEGKFDGSDLKVTAPEASDDQTKAFTILSPQKLEYKGKVGGRTTEIGTQTLSADGETLTDVSWSPGSESQKSTEVFNKQ